MRRTDLYLTKKQYDFIKKLSVDDGVTFSEYFRKIIDYFLAKEHKNDYKIFRKGEKS